MKKLAIITTHPIQYNAPFFRMLHGRNNIAIKVFYTWSQTAEGPKYDPGFKQNIEWDIPLLSGYPYTFCQNVSTAAGSHHYNGIDNPALINEVAEWGADALLVYGWNFKSHLHAMRFFKNKIPVFFRGDSTLIDEKPGIRKLLRRIYLRYIFLNVTAALYAGTANKAYFLAHGIKEKDLVFMPHAVENTRFKNEALSGAGPALRQKLKIPINAAVFLFAGKLEDKKQPALLAEAFSKLENNAAYLVIAGSGELEATLKDKFGTHPQVRFTGFINQQQMPALYACCNVFVLPSQGPGETWGLSINEAMAAGKAVIVSDACGAAADLVSEGVNGFVFKKDDKQQLQQHLFFFAEDITRAAKAGIVSAEIITSYSYENDCRAAEKLFNHYKAIKS